MVHRAEKKPASVVLFAVVAVCPHHAPNKVAAFFKVAADVSVPH